ncbi:hypothetical protein AB7813_27180 [Tardiphaga sp. 20_F10_N6_6]|uniref:hypothetical protein n=1 Tax=Tardiphaga sp. 20_F10_N6_6 TaxID=3240788 RepID=UPI003F888A18
MAITNDQELAGAVTQAGDLIQSIQDYCAKTNREDAKVRFPRGLIGTADTYRARFPAYLDHGRISNCSFSFMFLDVLWWLSARTDITGVAKQMILKSAIVTIGTILEACLYVPNLPKSKLLSNQCAAGVKQRVDNACTRGWISEPERDALKQLWDHRLNVHQKIAVDSELDLYNRDHVNIPQAALLVLMTRLREWNGKD